jgi:hypothetical protein
MRTIAIALFSMTFLAAAHADPSFTLNPSSGIIFGSPGSTVGWGFDLTSDPSLWVTVTSSMVLIEDNPLGVYSDFIGLQGGPFGGALQPNAPDWIENFNAATQSGLGGYAIDPLTPAGQIDDGLLLVEYETFSENPATCGSCYVATGEFFEDFTIQTVATPEPSFAILLGFGLLGLGVALKHRSLARQSASRVTARCCDDAR